MYLQEGEWMWAKSVKPMEFSAWYEGQPDNWQENQDCLVNMKWNNSDKYLWDDKSCTEWEAKPLCQIFN